MPLEIALLVISCGACAAGVGYVRLARRMRSYRTVEGRVTGREIAVVAGAGGEGSWGKGGRYTPKITYVYTVDGRTHTADRWSYANDGVRRSIAEQQLVAINDTVTVFYDPHAPEQAYLHTHSPRLGYWLLAGGSVGILAALVTLLAS